MSRSTPSETQQPASLFQAMAAVDLRQDLQQQMQQCRQGTLSLFEEVDTETFCRQAHPDFSPIGWHLGHIAYTEALWLLEHCAGQPRPFPNYSRLFAADGLPKTARVHLPTLPEIILYLEAVREQVFDYLKIAPLEQQERLWRWLLQHESQHGETIAIVLQLQHQRSRSVPHTMVTDPLPLLSEMVEVPAGEYEQGNAAIVALDNERPVQRLHLETFWIDRYPVTCGQYRVFIQAGGYRKSCWWSAAGWQWLQTHSVEHPLYWSDDPAFDHHPVNGVSYYEAEAYAQFVGKRLPTEAEWEKAASWDAVMQQRRTFPWGETAPTLRFCNHNYQVGGTTPVNQYPTGKSAYGCYDLLGNVWEWTSSWFDGYPGFEHYPYRGYSQVYFDGEHRVLRGGSWATRPWAMRAAFRNWYHPHVREIFAGFRCAADCG